MARSDAPFSKAVASALSETLASRVAPDERRWIDRIEEARGELSDSSEVARFIDYGSGPAERQLRPEADESERTVVTTIGAECRRVSKSPKWSLLLFKLVRELRPSTCLELGTCVGVSAAYEAAALKLNGGGRLITLEGAPPLAAAARQSLDRLDLAEVEIVVGRFQDTLPPLLRRIAPVDFAFVDGHHDERATLDYFELIVSGATSDAAIVFDDIDWSAGMARAWQTISSHPQVANAVDLGPIGIVALRSTDPPGEAPGAPGRRP